MGVTAEIGQYLFGASERWLGVDHPVEALEFAQATCEGLRFGKLGEIGEELQLAGPEGALQLLQEQPAEQPREDAQRQEEAGADGGDPFPDETSAVAPEMALNVPKGCSAVEPCGDNRATGVGASGRSIRASASSAVMAGFTALWRRLSRPRQEFRARRVGESRVASKLVDCRRGNACGPLHTLGCLPRVSDTGSP